MGEKTTSMKAVIIQLNSSNNKLSNLLQVEKWVTQAYEKFQPKLVALPEMFAFMGGELETKKAAAEVVENSAEALESLKKLAKKYQIFIHGGSLCERESNQYFNTSCVFNPGGKLVAQYRKINLFNFTSGKIQYNEAALLSPGHNVVTYCIDDITVGCAICFDLRFGNIFQELIKKKVDIIIVPSAFTFETGKAHWEILCRARAIETQSFILAPAQTGQHSQNGQQRVCFGHSLVIDPWGNVIAKLEEEVGFACATLDFNFLKYIRETLPCYLAKKSFNQLSEQDI